MGRWRVKRFSTETLIWTSYVLPKDSSHPRDNGAFLQSLLQRNTHCNTHRRALQSSLSLSVYFPTLTFAFFDTFSLSKSLRDDYNKHVTWRPNDGDQVSVGFWRLYSMHWILSVYWIHPVTAKWRSSCDACGCRFCDDFEKHFCSLNFQMQTSNSSNGAHWGNRVKLVKRIVHQSVIVDWTPWIRRLLFASQLDIMTMHLNFEVTNQKACHCHHHPGGFLEFGVFPMKRCFRWLLSS